MSERLDAAERLLALVIALSHTSHRMTKGQIRSGVAGYADATSDASFERMFERDKDTLRSLGVPLITLTDSTHEDDVGYRIDTSAYALPAVDFSPAEVGVLSLAAQVWQDSAMSAQARRGLTKLRATTTRAEDLRAPTALRVRGPGEAFDVLLESIVARQAVRFEYRAASTGTTAGRSVEPWRLFAQDRGWYLVGFDRDRGAQRSFRLSRITGNVQAVGPAGQVQVPASTEPPRPAPPIPVLLAVLPGRAAALRARAVDVQEAAGVAASDGEGAPDREGAPDGEGAPGGESPPDGATHPGSAESRRPTPAADLATRDLVTIETADPEMLAEEIATYGAAVLVREPDHVRASVVRRLRAVAGLDRAGKVSADG